MALRHFGLSGAASPLDSERDQNFRLAVGDEAWILKIVNASEPAVESAFQTALLDHLARTAPDLAVPRLRKTLGGAVLGEVAGSAGERHAVRLVSWLQGRPLAETTRGPALFESLGAMLGRLDRALQGFIHPGALRSFDWDIRRAGDA
ncbi:phosphotransferase, partial [Rhizobiaceae sp. 2RAB30]